MATDAVTRMNDRTSPEERKHGIRLRVHSPRRSDLRPSASPSPRRIVSARTNEENRASVGDLIQIVGQNLHFDPQDARSGVFFVDYGETRSVHYAHVSSDLVIVQVPSGLSPGPYLIRIRNSSGGAEAREGRAASVFVVE